MTHPAPNSELTGESEVTLVHSGASASVSSQLGVDSAAILLATEQLRAHLDPTPRRVDGNGYSFLNLAPRIKCADGLHMSVQASRTHYCSPREDHGGWYEVEVGFPSRQVAAFKQYAEDPKRLTKTVYGWVPLLVVAQVIAEHGGIKPTPASSVGTEPRSGGVNQ